MKGIGRWLSFGAVCARSNKALLNLQLERDLVVKGNPTSDIRRAVSESQLNSGCKWASL